MKRKCIAGMSGTVSKRRVRSPAGSSRSERYGYYRRFVKCDGKRRGDAEARCVIISGRAEGADRPTGKPKSSCACKPVNLQRG